MSIDMGKILCMGNFDTKEAQIRASLNMARQNYGVQDLADMFDIDRKVMGSFLAGTNNSPKILKSGENIARELGFWPWDDYNEKAAAQKQSESSVAAEYNLLAKQLEAFADYCVSQAPTSIAGLDRIEEGLRHILTIIEEARNRLRDFDNLRN